MSTTVSNCLDDLVFIAFDVETTGLSPVAHRLVELSGVKFTTGSSEVETFSRLINPEVHIPPRLTEIHGITDEMVAGADTFHKVVPDFLEFAGNEAVLIAHNAPFDVEFLRFNIARCSLACPKNHVIDTLTLSRELILDAPRYQLQSVVEHLGLPSGGFHRALADSVHVKELFLKLVNRNNLTSLSELSTLGVVTTFDYDRHEEAVAEALPGNVKQIMETLREAINQKQRLRMTYEGAYRTTRRVLPTALLHSRGQFYLNAFCEKAREERTFRLDRIASLGH